MLTSITRTAAALVCCAFLPCATPAAAQSVAAPGIRSYPVPGHGAMVFALPSDWRHEILQGEGFALTVVLSPATGDDFKTMITPLWKSEGGQSQQDPAEVQRLVEMDLRTMLPTAVEKEVPLQTINGRDGAGYYFLVTDQAPKSGEYPYAVRAGIVVGDLLLSTTILCRSKDSPGIAATVEALRTAQQMGK